MKYEFIPILFYITKLFTASNRFNALIFNSSDLAQFCNRWIMANGQSYRIFSGQYLFVSNISNNQPCIIEPGTIFQKQDNLFYICTKVHIKSKTIEYQRIMSYSAIKRSKLLIIKNIFKAINQCSNFLMLKNLENHSLKKCFFLIYSFSKTQSISSLKISTNIQLRDYIINENITENNDNLFLGKIKCFGERTKIYLTKIKEIIEEIQKQSFCYNYPKYFFDGKNVVLLVEIWSDDFSSFKNKKQANTSYYLLRICI